MVRGALRQGCVSQRLQILTQGEALAELAGSVRAWARGGRALAGGSGAGGVTDLQGGWDPVWCGGGGCCWSAARFFYLVVCSRDKGCRQQQRPARAEGAVAGAQGQGTCERRVGPCGRMAGSGALLVGVDVQVQGLRHCMSVATRRVYMYYRDCHRIATGRRGAGKSAGNRLLMVRQFQALLP